MGKENRIIRYLEGKDMKTVNEADAAIFLMRVPDRYDGSHPARAAERDLRMVILNTRVLRVRPAAHGMHDDAAALSDNWDDAALSDNSESSESSDALAYSHSLEYFFLGKLEGAAHSVLETVTKVLRDFT